MPHGYDTGSTEFIDDHGYRNTLTFRQEWSTAKLSLSFPDRSIFSQLVPLK